MFKNTSKLRLLWLGSIGLVGAISGFLYYHFIGCNGGCMIWNSPFISTGYGALLGWLVASLVPIGLPRKGGQHGDTNVETKEA